ncbi:MAG: hypothetical protein K6E93_04915 [Bacteroidales bacterium]|nr:hypothetical protein [Bacteroidales bacterium]
MKKSLKVFLLTMTVLVDLVILCGIAPTLWQQVPFNQWVWEHHPVRKVRYYMSESLIEKLNKERPSYEETLALLGEDMYNRGGHVYGGNQLQYWLKSDAIVGLKYYSLLICYDDGRFESARIVYED